MQKETLALGRKFNNQEKEAETDVYSAGNMHVSACENTLTVSQANMYSGLQM